jgi:hypothetical protein
LTRTDFGCPVQVGKLRRSIGVANAAENLGYVGIYR